ncbi:MAG: hypothetical protein VZR05_03680 [Lachnospiraceae bacterium]|nr:hypothetical protein [Lachnospiraceae bacterium]
MEKYDGFDLEIIMIGEQDIVCTSLVYSPSETEPVPVGREDA